MAAIVFSITALESFANEEIPEDHQYTFKKASGVFVVEGKEWIERNKSLSEKLSSILPKIFGVSSLKGTKPWQEWPLRSSDSI